MTPAALQPKKLIEVAMPIREVSAESVRDKSIRHGHISTLHLWWARRPLPVCRAVVFASLVPDPLDEHCPKAFCEAVELVLGKAANPGDPYKPYKNIPWTSAVDPMDDNARNRLLMFIGKFSEKYIANEEKGKKTDAKEQLAPDSLIKWESRNDPKIIGKARRLIWVAHNTKSDAKANAETLIAEHDRHFAAIQQAEEALYGTPDRHLGGAKVQKLEVALHAAIEAYLQRMPTVFDPFAGGGAIPLEAARLGCRSYGNDLNPVAHIIQRGSLEFPQKYGKPITYSKAEYVKRYGDKSWEEQPLERKVITKGEATAITIPNRLAHDVEFHARNILRQTEAVVGKYYPSADGQKTIAYYWARVATCSNPACRAEVPLLKGFYLCQRKDKKVYLKPIIHGNKIDFELTNGEHHIEGWMRRASLVCPCCGSATDARLLKEQFIAGTASTRMLAVICEGEQGKVYRLPNQKDLDVVAEVPQNQERPQEPMPVTYSQALPCCTWGMSVWGDLFTNRQLYTLHTLCGKLNKLKQDFETDSDPYAKALLTYLAVFVDRVAVVNTSFGLWEVGLEKLQRVLSRQAIPMIFDYPESNLFCGIAGSAENQLEWIIKYVESEGVLPFASVMNNSASGEREQFPAKSIEAVITDPPYYDAIAYADMSDFFYVWLKRTIGEVYPLTFSTPQTPKTDECTALKHHHDGSSPRATAHFEQKLMQIFDAIEHQTKDVVSIMFAHQSTEAWTTLCNSILGAHMNITGSWANDTEMMGALKTDKAHLASSVTVCARPAQRKGTGSFRDVRNGVEQRVHEEVALLYKLGFRGADLLTACFGQAVSEFGQYERVEKADGSEVTVAELLEMARESAFNALLKGFDGDDYTKFSIGWLQLYGFGEAEFDDAAKFSRVGITLNVQELIGRHLFIQEGNKLTLATSAQRTTADANLGKRANSPLIDGVHRAMQAYKGGNRNYLLKAISECGPDSDHAFWRVLNSLAEVLPANSEDLALAKDLLANKDNLLREARQTGQPSATQTQIGFDA